MRTERSEIKADFLGIGSKELFDLMCGEIIGEGSSRIVFENKMDPNTVIKYQAYAGFQNVQEWELWCDVGPVPDTAKWLAPCCMISPNGVWLIQKKTTPVPKDFKWPDRVPKFLTDMNRSNFGLYEGRLVSHDYGLNLCANYAISKATRKHDWHS